MEDGKRRNTYCMKKLITMVASLALAVGCMLPQHLHAEETAEAIVKTKEELQAALITPIFLRLH